MTPTERSLGPVGETVDRIRRMFYVYQGEVDRRAGPLEVSFADGSVRLYDAGPDGERLSVDEHAWVDPFEGDLDEANREFVARSGKWTAFDVSDEAPYDAFIGARVDAIDPVPGTDGSTVGVTMRAGNRRLRATVGADELIVVGT